MDVEDCREGDSAGTTLPKELSKKNVEEKTVRCRIHKLYVDFSSLAPGDARRREEIHREIGGGLLAAAKNEYVMFVKQINFFFPPNKPPMVKQDYATALANLPKPALRSDASLEIESVLKRAIGNAADQALPETTPKRQAAYGPLKPLDAPTPYQGMPPRYAPVDPKYIAPPKGYQPLPETYQTPRAYQEFPAELLAKNKFPAYLQEKRIADQAKTVARFMEKLGISGCKTRNMPRIGHRVLLFETSADVAKFMAQGVLLGSGVRADESTFDGASTGLFATQAFAVGVPITEYEGDRVDLEKALELRRYGHGGHLEPLRAERWFVHGRIFPRDGQGGGSFANDNILRHSTMTCKKFTRCPERPYNAELVVVTTRDNDARSAADFDPRAARLVLVSLLPIDPGTEILVRGPDSFAGYAE